MKKSLSRQFIVILIIPLILMMAANYYIITTIRNDQVDRLKSYCDTTLDNIEINIASMATCMKKTSTMFSSKQETQSYLGSSSEDTHQLQRQSFSDLISMSQSYTPDLVDIIVWDKVSPTSMISYISANMENCVVDNFVNSDMNKQSYFEFYIQPTTQTIFLMYFSPIYMTTFSEDFGKYIGNIAVICKTETLNKLVNSTSDMQLQIRNGMDEEILYSNNYSFSESKSSNSKIYENSVRIPSTNLVVYGTVYTDHINLLDDSRSSFLLLFAILSLFYLIYIAIAVHHILIKPIHTLNEKIESLDYEHDQLHIHTSSKNEIGSIAHHVNTLLEKIYTLNQRNIASQARIYEMEISKKQTQLYAYQSQINPHFLYNMLQCMRGICQMHGIPEVAKICTNMADLFRYSIKGAFLVYLEDELNIIDKYLYMTQIRFRDKIRYNMDISENTKMCKIPKMILQPLVENSIFHGLEPIEENGFIQIKTFRNDHDLYITIHDNGIGFDSDALKELNEILSQDIPNDINSTFNESKGLGIINIHNKIRLYEGSDYGIKIVSEPYNTLITIHLNAKQTDYS